MKDRYNMRLMLEMVIVGINIYKKEAEKADNVIEEAKKEISE
jgi:hypothetical protein